MRWALPRTSHRAPCRYSSTGAPGCGCGSHRPCRRTGWPVSAERNGIHTSSMPWAAASPPDQVRSLGWKIQARCFSSSVAQPLARPSAAAAASTAAAPRRRQRGGRGGRGRALRWGPGAVVIGLHRRMTPASAGSCGADAPARRSGDHPTPAAAQRRGRRHGDGAADGVRGEAARQLRAVVHVPHDPRLLPAAAAGGGGGTGDPLCRAALQLCPGRAGTRGARGRTTGQRRALDHAELGWADRGADGLPDPAPQLRRPGPGHRRAAVSRDGGLDAHHPQHGGAGPAGALGGG